jgi:hypothetical protein
LFVKFALIDRGDLCKIAHTMLQCENDAPSGNGIRLGH